MIQSQASFEELTKFFFEIHDPTQKNGQGPDIGSQYLSAVFYSSDEEKEITQSLVDQLVGKGYDVATQAASRRALLESRRVSPGLLREEESAALLPYLSEEILDCLRVSLED